MAASKPTVPIRIWWVRTGAAPAKPYGARFKVRYAVTGLSRPNGWFLF